MVFNTLNIFVENGHIIIEMIRAITANVNYLFKYYFVSLSKPISGRNDFNCKNNYVYVFLSTQIINNTGAN